MAIRIREAYTDNIDKLDGIIEMDETYIGGEEKNKHASKHGYIGTYHWFSKKHIDRYVNEFAGRRNSRKLDTIEQMKMMANSTQGKRLGYKELVNGQ